MKSRFSIMFVGLLALLAVLVACQPQVITETVEVEVTRVVTETETVIEEVEVVKEVEKEVEVVKEVEVEKIVEVIVDPTACNMPAPAAATEINMIGWSFPITDFYAEELEKCSEVENVTVNTQLLDSSSAQEQVNLALSGGGDSPYDIVHGANGQVSTWAAEGWIMPLNDMVEKYWDEYDLGDIPAKAWEGATIDGQMYGVPIVANTLHMIYREDIFADAGIDVPDNYEEVIAACNAIGLDNPDYDAAFTINLSAGWAWEIEFFQMIRAFGGDYLGEGNAPAFNGQEGIDAVNMMVAVADACMGPDGYTFNLNDQEVAVQLGTLPATNMWASRAANMGDPERTDLFEVITFAPAPRATADGPRAGSAWNDYYMIPAATTQDAETVFLAIMEAADARSQLDGARVGPITRLSASNSAKAGPYLAAMGQTIDEGIGIYPINPAVGIVRSKLGEFLPLVGTGEMTAEEALNAAAEAYIEEATAQGFIDG